jgi:ribosomal-protein-alanine N-acetyltransferase
MLIRSMLEADLAAVEQLEAQLFSSPLNRSQLTSALNSRHWLWVVERQAEIAGYLIAHHGGGVADLLTIGVDPSQQRNGIGQQLLAVLLEQLQSARVDELFLEVRRSNRSAIGLYQRCGMTSVGVRKGYYPCLSTFGSDSRNRREDAIVMRYRVLPDR